jgi:hypothetical protein
LFYIDTVLSDTRTLTTNNLSISAFGKSPSFDGKMDQVRFFNDSISSDDVYNMYYNFPVITNPCDTTTIILNSVVVDVNCYGDSTGSISLNPVGGDGNYTYIWSTGDDTQNINDLPAGNYTVTVTDGNGCYVLSDFEVTQPPALNNSHVSLDVSCYDYEDGSSSITTTGGSSPYDYNWVRIGGGYDSTVVGVTSAVVNNLSVGTYNLFITDAQSCEDTINFDVLNQTPITIYLGAPSVVVDDTLLQGVGYIEPEIVGGAGVYTNYLWLPDGESTKNIYNKVAGSYTLLTIDANGCDTSQVFTISNYIPAGTPGTLDTIAYSIDTKYRDWYYKINQGVLEANQRIPETLSTVLLTDPGEIMYNKCNAFIKQYPEIQNDTLIWQVDNNTQLKIKVNAAIRIEGNLD